MNKNNQKVKYIIISPVKDEQQYIEDTLKSVISQTLKPYRWIIVDDGSQDATKSILMSYSSNYAWITVMRIERDAQRLPGSGVVNAFLHGYQKIINESVDFVVKLDCDLRFEQNYFEKIFKEFIKDENLGIASGIYLEDRTGSWVPVEMPSYHAAGACKVIRKKCYDQIGGFIANRGWDTVDEIKAQVLGWKTRHFKYLQFYHLKNEGSGIGWISTNLMLGEIYYHTGGSKLFFILKVMHRMLFDSPFMFSGVIMLYGYIKQLVLRGKLLVSDKEAQFYKRLLNKRIISRFTL